MNLRNLQQTELETFLTPQRVMTLRVIYIALAMSPMMFLVVIGVILSNSTDEMQSVTPDASLIQTLSMVVVIVSLLSYSLFPALPKLLTKARARQTLPEVNESNVNSVIEYLYKSYLSGRVLSLATFEFPAMLGLVVSLVAITTGVLPEQQIFWFNLLPTLILITYIAGTFPNRERIASGIQQQQS